ncbi:tetratricopeptide repeat protein [Edaphobacter modestus]|uniref:Tetratricopeptide repeat protein n=1 Tax=Edaphobacter modestus TaxID=388466 RepID=A0A4Q7XXT7_9BACT|nr:tetratricopeptide repeat protein [Edaphobacter modestus]RZU28898.1 tetratricopeptide repeat protein [Edaphobacter modestus]
MLRFSKARRKTISCGIPLLFCMLPSIQSSGQSTLPPELKGAPKSMPAVTEDDRELGKLLEGIHGEKLSDSQRHLIDAFIGSHPNYPGGYAIRAMYACADEKPGLSQLESDLTQATAHPSGMSATLVDNPASLRAKIAFVKGDYRAALDLLSSAASADWSSAPQVFNISGTKPEEEGGGFCAWTLANLDVLVENFPTDWRASALRGAYVEFFTTFGDESLYATAATQFHLADTKAPQSPVPPYLLGELRNKASFWTKKAWTSDAARVETHKEAAAFFTTSLTRDPSFAPAYMARAEAYLNTKQYASSIKDFTRVLSISPQNSTAVADRGNAYMESGAYYKAISDFTTAIPLEIKNGDSYLHTIYETRGDAYMKVGDLRSAISDYSAALRLAFGNLTILLSVPQIRALYPELKSLSDADVVRLMHDQFHPEVQYQGFADELLHNDGHYEISLINDVYEKRGDAYIQSGRFADGVNDFQRIYRGIRAFSDSVERWRPLDQSHAPISYFLDVKGSVLSGSLKRVWVKRSEKSGYQVISFEFNCASREMRTLSEARYNAQDDLLGSPILDSDSWRGVVPDTIGERLLNGVCSSD